MICCIHSRILLTECASELLYSVQNIANIRIRLIFDSSNTLVYRLSPNHYHDDDHHQLFPTLMYGHVSG